jgi:hypothetical protein
MYKAIFLVTNLENKNIVPICHGYPQNVMIYSQDINNIHSFLETFEKCIQIKKIYLSTDLFLLYNMLTFRYSNTCVNRKFET